MSKKTMAVSFLSLLVSGAAYALPARAQEPAAPAEAHKSHKGCCARHAEAARDGEAPSGVPACKRARAAADHGHDQCCCCCPKEHHEEATEKQ